jgi:phage pi2 protein 07
MIQKRLLKLKDSGDDVLFIQKKLKDIGLFNDSISGYYGQNTLISISNFQKIKGLRVTGEVDIQTWTELTKSKNIDTTNSNNLIIKTNSNLEIYSIDDKVDYYKTVSLKKSIVISNTGVGYNPKDVVNFWKPIYNNSKELIRSSHFLIGRMNLDVKDYDGLVFRAFDDKYWSYPFLSDNLSDVISVDICNLGPLVSIGDKFYNLMGNVVPSNEVLELNFLGYNYYHKYTDNQIQNLKKLLIYLQLKHGIQINRGSYTEDGIIPYYDDKWFSNINLESNGIKTKNNYINSLFGLTPQKEIVDMLNSI